MKPYESKKILNAEFKLDRTNPTINRLCELRDCTHPVKDFRITNTQNQISAKDVNFTEIDEFVDSWTTSQDRFPKTVDILKWVFEKRKNDPETKKEVASCKHGFCSGNGYVEVKEKGSDDDYLYLKWCACNPEVGQQKFISKVLPNVTDWQRDKIDSGRDVDSLKGIAEGKFYCDLVSFCEMEPSSELWEKIKSQKIIVPDEYMDMRQNLVGKGKQYISVSSLIHSLWGDDIKDLPHVKRTQKKWADSTEKANIKVATKEELQGVFNILQKGMRGEKRWK